MQRASEWSKVIIGSFRMFIIAFTLVLAAGSFLLIPCTEAHAATRQDLVAKAEQQVNNGGKTYVDAFGMHWGPKDCTQWCHIFVSWCARELGIEGDIVPWTASCIEGSDWFDAKGKYHNIGDGYVPQPGDIVYFHTSYTDQLGDNQPHHVGIVRYCENGRVYVVDGNHGTNGSYNNIVALSSYPQNGTPNSSSSRTWIVGYGETQWPYEPDSDDSHNPSGGIYKIEGYTGSFFIGGYAVDPDDESQALRIDAYVGGPAQVGEGHQLWTSGGPNHDFASIEATSLTGWQTVYVYAVNVGPGESTLIGTPSVYIQPDTEAPTLSGVEVKNVGSGGYTVSCRASDNAGVHHLVFATWCEADRAGTEVHSVVSANSSGTYSFDVKPSAHGDRTGLYHTHVYAYDAAGNQSQGAPVDVLVPKAMANLGHSTYFLYDEGSLSWPDAEQRCERAYGGGHLATIESAEEEAVIEGLVASGGMQEYAIGASDAASEGVWRWPLGEYVDSYQNWGEGESMGGTSENYAGIRKSDMKWFDYGGSGWSTMGYIMEVENFYDFNGTVTTDFPEGTYTINPSGNEGLAADIAGGSTSSEANLQLYQANGTNAQRFVFTKNSDDGTYTITNKQSGLALDVTNGIMTDEANVAQHEPNGSAAQRWYVEVAGDGCHCLRSKINNLYLDVSGGVLENWTNLQTYHGNGTSSQKFVLKRGEVPSIRNWKAYDVTPDGYKVHFEIDAPQGVQSIHLPTWTPYADGAGQVWYEASASGGQVDFEVKVSNHGGVRGVYRTHVYVRDSFGCEYGFPYFNDVLVPTAVASWSDKTYYLIDSAMPIASANECLSDQVQAAPGSAHLATVESAEEQAVVERLVSGGSCMAYWLAASDEDDEGNWTWWPGGPVSYSNWGDGEGVGGTNENHVAMTREDGYWRDFSGEGSMGLVVEFEGDDRVGPDVSDASVASIDETGFTLCYKLEDPSGVKSTDVVVWAQDLGEDDALVGVPVFDGDGTAYYRVNTADHKNAGGHYAVRIVAFDKLGNKSTIDLSNRITAIVPDAAAQLDDAVYYRFDQAMTWTEACEFVATSLGEGMHLASILSEDDEDQVASLLAGAGKSAYWLGLANGGSGSEFAWADGSALEYTRWASGQPGSPSEARYAAVLASNLKWYAYGDAGTGSDAANMGFIVKMANSDGDADVCQGEHEWGDWEVVKAATCSEAGVEARFCDRCGDSESREVAKLAHTASAAVRENERAATCSQAGGYDEVVYCSVCGEEVSRTAHEVAKLAHEWGEGVVTAGPTCTEAGVRTFACSACNETRMEPVAATGHAPGDPVVENATSASTCVEGGSFGEVVYCSACGVELSREHKATEAGAHTVVVDPAVAPTCTQAGLTEGSHCLVCGEVIQKQEVVAALGHHAVEVAAVAPTCTEPGAAAGTRCDVCGEALSGLEAKPALGHDYADAVVAPTCTVPGRTDHVCSRCGDSYSDTETPATGHVPGETAHENVVAATCTQDGGHDDVVRCSACGEELSRTARVDRALGHAWGSEEVLVVPTCAAQGARTFTCLFCGQTKAEVIPATGHVHGAVVREGELAPTCVEAGGYDLVSRCDVCDVELSRIAVTTDPLGHDYVESVVAPTQDKGGYTLHKCSRCGDEYTTDEVASLEDQEARAAAQKAAASIAALPSAASITLADEAKVASARAEYDALTAGQKALVDVVALEAAEARLVELRAAAKSEADAAAASAVSRTIAALPETNVLTLADEPKVRAARVSYDSLADDQKARLDTLALRVLVAAESKISDLKKAAEQPADTRVSLSGATVTASSLTYNGSVQVPAVTVRTNGKALKAGTDYELGYRDAKGSSISGGAVKTVGTYQAVVTGKGSYKGEKAVSFKVNAASISGAKVIGLETKAYTGKAATQSPTVILDSVVLKPGVDYTVSSRNAKGSTVKAANIKAAGTYKMVAKGKGNYTGTVVKPFKVSKARISAAKFSKIAKQTLKKAGKAVKPKVTVKFGGKVLKKGVDYTLAYKNNKKAGTARAVIKGKGNFSGSKTIKFKIVVKKPGKSKVSAQGTIWTNGTLKAASL